MYTEQHISKIQTVSNIFLKVTNQTYAVDVGIWEFASQILMEASLMQKKVLSKGYSILIQKSQEELSSLFNNRLAMLGLIGGLLSVLVLGLFLVLKLREENELRSNMINVLKIFFIIPQYMVFKNRSMHYILQKILENDF